MLKHVSLKKLLRNRLKEKQLKNPRYSLRAFSRDLGVTPASLSRYLNREQGFSIRTVSNLLDVLQVTSLEREFILSDFTAKSFKEEMRVKKALARKEEIITETYTSLDEESFNLLQAWYHCGILALIETRDFSGDPAWIAKRLGIETTAATKSLSSMIELEMIVCGADGKWKVNGHYFASSDGKPRTSTKNFHKQMISKALDSVELRSLSERDLSSLLLPVKADQMDEARRLIQEFREMFAQRFNVSLAESERDEVFALNIQFFKVTDSTVSSVEQGSGGDVA